MTAKKPATMRQNRNKPTMTLVAVPSVRQIAPEPPKELLSWTKRHWETFFASDVARASGDVDLWAAEVFYTTLDEWRRCVLAARKTPFIEGSMKQPRINPQAERADRLASKLPALAAEIGVSPLARSKLAISVGDAAKSIEELTRHAREVETAENPLTTLVESAQES